MSRTNLPSTSLAVDNLMVVSADRLTLLLFLDPRHHKTISDSDGKRSPPSSCDVKMKKMFETSAGREVKDTRK